MVESMSESGFVGSPSSPSLHPGVSESKTRIIIPSFVFGPAGYTKAEGFSTQLWSGPLVVLPSQKNSTSAQSTRLVPFQMDEVVGAAWRRRRRDEVAVRGLDDGQGPFCPPDFQVVGPGPVDAVAGVVARGRPAMRPGHGDGFGLTTRQQRDAQAVVPGGAPGCAGRPAGGTSGQKGKGAQAVGDAGGGGGESWKAPSTKGDAVGIGRRS